MRVCLISEYFYPDNGGGTGTVLSSLIRHLKDTHPHVEIDVITSSNVYRGEATNLLSQEDWQGVQIHRVEARKAHASCIKKRLLDNFRLTFLVLKKMLRLGKYDLVVVSTAPPPMPIAARLYKLISRTPYAYIIYDLYPDIAVALDVLQSDSKPSKVLHWLQKGWLKNASQVMVLGRCMSAHLQTKYGVAPNSISVVPIGADVERVVPADKVTNFRRANNLEGFVVLWAGNFGWHQDFDAILDAAKQLQNTHSEIRFAFVGDGAKKVYIEDRLKSENIDNVQLFPFVPETEFCDMLASADVSLVALEPGAEGLGVPSKFYNILASGRPVVAIVSQNSEVAHTIQESGCGVRVDRDGDQLAQALMRLQEQPATLKTMGQRARRVCEENFSMQQVSRQFYSALRAAIISDSLPLAPSASQQIKMLPYEIDRMEKPESVV